ncbi:MAG: biotin--[acetyl-CoA-carboxylase] ligase [Flavobacteriales bacterium]|nr:MAG: biotin--[acetyl-CoA-carboxylase] ligase [Flavobacteriales bacterium]
MKIVKLSATNSTNDYLRNLLKQNKAKNNMVVVADYQTSGKGIGSNIWYSEKGKNLLFSVLISFEDLPVARQYYLNFAVSIAVYNVLKYYIPEKLLIKWPNDILSANQKICGILIECVVKQDKVIHAVIGVGLNVNQTNFSDDLFNVTSLKLLLINDVDREDLLEKMLIEIHYQILFVKKQAFSELKDKYEAVLYKKNIPTVFSDANGNKFMGKIIGTASQTGNLLVEMEDETIREFGIKEIQMLA